MTTSGDPPAARAFLGRYELLLQLASGGMASVFVGRLSGAGGFQRLVAVKRMHEHVANDADLSAAFRDEARIASLIRHPNVVGVIDVFEHDGEQLLVMEYVEGESVATLLSAVRRRRAKLARPIALRIAVDALNGLHAAHEQTALDGHPLAIVHRDVSPQNLLISVDGTVRIADFGIARAAERSAHTMTGLIKGKLRYMAPEHARGRPIDRRVDLFAVGVILWEMLSGERLYKGDTDADILRSAVAADILPLHKVDPTTPVGLEEVVMRALAPRPEDRWPTARHFAAALEAWAWEAHELASPAEIAAALDESCGDAIRARAARVQDVLAGRSPPAIRFGRRSFGDGGTTGGTVSPLGSVSPAPGALPFASAPGGRGAGRAIAASIGVLGVFALVAAAVFMLRRGQRSDGAMAALSAAPAPTATAAARVRVQVDADAVIAGLHAPGIDHVAIDARRASFDLPLSSEPITLTVTLEDGTELDETLVPDSNLAVRVRGAVPTPKTASAAAPRPPPSPKGPLPPAPARTLRKNPYE